MLEELKRRWVWWVAVLIYCLRGIIKIDLSRLYIEHDISEGGPIYSKYVLEDGRRSNRYQRGENAHGPA